jgi:hypothetical protein
LRARPPWQDKLVVSRRGAIAAVGVIALASAAGAPAGGGNKEQIRFNAADQAAARAVVLRMSDLGSAQGWKGGARKPDLSSGPACPNYNPKQSDLVLTGAAHTEFAQAALDFDSEADVLQTARMVRLDWQRSVLSPGVLPCLRSYAAKSAPAHTRIVSIERLAFPHVATYSAAFRLVSDVGSSGSTVRVLADIALVGRGRTEVVLTTTAPYAARVPVRAAEIRLARILAARIRA